MNAREWALIVFTVLTQMSVGSFLVLGVVHFFAARKAGMEEADRLSDRALLSIVVVLALAMLASLLHLGNPINAPRAVTNLATSWLSREVLSGVVFAILGVIFAVMQWRKVASFAVRNVIAWITALIGLILVFCESMIYMLPTEPSWNTLTTPVSFYTTTLLLGSLAMGAAFVANYAYVQRKNPGCADAQCELMRGALRWIAIASILLVGIDLVVIPVYFALLVTGPSAAVSSAKLIVDHFMSVFVLRLVLAFIGAGVFGVFLYQNAQSAGRERILGYQAYSAFVLVLVAEVLGRFLFYATHIRIGV
ncbi:MAG: dimethyl sulfoxide reductase anchor subunit [Anaerolineales bacterium]|jgi:anaerobic dimethyl sulfoxide reductase subunit C (anchor subunit)